MIASKLILTSLPVELIDQELLPYLSLSSLVSCAITCSLLRLRCRRFLLQKQAAQRKQQKILECLFEDGFRLVRYFQKTLLYPVFNRSGLTQRLYGAAKGM